MQNSLFQAICRLGIFMICVRAIIHFRPNEAYEKYLRLLAGIMIMIQIFLPVGKLILGRGGQEASEILRQFRRELERGMEEAAESAEAADVLLEQMTLEEVQRHLEDSQDSENRADGDGEAGWGSDTAEAGTSQEREAEGGESSRESGTVEAGTSQGAEEGRGETGEEVAAEQKYDTNGDRKSDWETGENWHGENVRDMEAADEGNAGITIRIEEIDPVLIEPIS